MEADDFDNKEGVCGECLIFIAFGITKYYLLFSDLMLKAKPGEQALLYYVLTGTPVTKVFCNHCLMYITPF